MGTSSFSRRLVPMLAAFTLAGCASTITAVTNRPISSDHLDEYGRVDGKLVRKDLNKLKTLSGDRRLIRVQFTDDHDPSKAFTDGLYRTRWIICAETQADAIASRGGQSALTINAQGSGTDEYAEALAVTNIRSPLSDVVRQLGWQVCNAFMNGALTKDEYRDQLDKLRHGAFLALKVDEAALKQAATPITLATTKIKFEADVKALPEAPSKP